MLATLSQLATMVAEEGGESEEVINPVLPDGAELFWGTVFFLLLLVVMWQVCLPPIRKAMRQRDEQVRDDLEAAERARTEAEQVRRDYDATLVEARAEAARIVEEARAAADARRAEVIAAAEAEVARARQEAMADIEAQRAEALRALTGEVAGIATAAAAKVVQRDLDPAAQRTIVDRYVAQRAEQG